MKVALKEGMAAGDARLSEIQGAIVAAGLVDPLAAMLGDDPVGVWRGTSDLHRRQAVIRAMVGITLGPPIRGRAEWHPEKFIRVEPA